MLILQIRNNHPTQTVYAVYAHMFLIDQSYLCLDMWFMVSIRTDISSTFSLICCTSYNWPYYHGTRLYFAVTFLQSTHNEYPHCSPLCYHKCLFYQSKVCTRTVCFEMALHLVLFSTQDIPINNDGTKCISWCENMNVRYEQGFWLRDFLTNFQMRKINNICIPLCVKVAICINYIFLPSRTCSANAELPNIIPVS